ncbi:hypothetical protein RXV86_07190 [Alisedimentitalea sp. MJ-SS2]|uniref:hypothetical protein n=1 Tax=Aliisedimentitalea sp. MJ-SS2 TaxID=3049795 RepID=UPI0029092A7C|nr:hypothetical protein [Alisedimentitalea sp. MJ-SS2]MDU8927163.1 hypothetical protein [Alisedimentitalea sp. MJ-SS2]
MALADTQITDHANAPADKSETSTALKLIITVLVALVAWGLSFFTWGVPGLYIPAVAAVPVMYLLLVIMARG